ncbi:barrier-to-autointegration factor-like protein [Dunckerocampus dactyliophorus]|uniref:barrier-to-autointegration factor-like protein n=1 Tax=Dunckerocampus dactyliophorus TaxID=161453 RepID=UPI002406C510|nr:barrier-to-autointegration factor-like protein [Dunckerocampus dactyliophorus]
MSTSRKHKDFVEEPMGEKAVTALPGIGPTLGASLSQQGFDKASLLLGQFLLLKEDTDKFADWLKDVCGASARQAAPCSQCLKEWCDAFL